MHDGARGQNNSSPSLECTIKDGAPLYSQLPALYMLFSHVQSTSTFHECSTSQTLIIHHQSGDETVPEREFTHVRIAVDSMPLQKLFQAGTVDVLVKEVAVREATIHAGGALANRTGKRIVVVHLHSTAHLTVDLIGLFTCSPQGRI